MSSRSLWVSVSRCITAAATLLLATLLLACDGVPMAWSGPSVRVELDVFSGRPNPFWELSPADGAEFQRLVGGLPPSARPQTEGGLGYRGFVVSVPRGAGSVPDEVRVYGGVVRVTAGGRVTEYEDRNGLERWLGDRARRRGLGDLISAPR